MRHVLCTTRTIDKQPERTGKFALEKLAGFEMATQHKSTTIHATRAQVITLLLQTETESCTAIGVCTPRRVAATRLYRSYAIVTLM